MQRIADELTAQCFWTRGYSDLWHTAQVARIIQRALDDAPATIARLEAEAKALRTLWEREQKRKE